MHIKWHINLPSGLCFSLSPWLTATKVTYSTFFGIFNSHSFTWSLTDNSHIIWLSQVLPCFGATFSFNFLMQWHKPSLTHGTPTVVPNTFQSFQVGKDALLSWSLPHPPHLQSYFIILVLFPGSLCPYMHYLLYCFCFPKHHQFKAIACD